MKKQKKTLVLAKETVRAMDHAELQLSVGGYGKTAYVCTGKLSNCAQCPE